jgi:hypothetical protein
VPWWDQRQCRRHSVAAEQRDELAALYSITSSAVASSVDGTTRPSALAVLRLTCHGVDYGTNVRSRLSIGSDET